MWEAPPLREEDHRGCTTMAAACREANRLVVVVVMVAMVVMVVMVGININNDTDDTRAQE